jgi:hypothetical protein
MPVAARNVVANAAVTTRLFIKYVSFAWLLS